MTSSLWLKIVTATTALALEAGAEAARPGGDANIVMPVGAHAEASRPDTGDWVVDLKAWVTAVYQHTPGSADEHAFAVGATSNQELYALVRHLGALTDRLATAKGRLVRDPRSPRTISYERRDIDVLALQQLLRLTDEEAERGDVNRLVTRAAMLHADIGMLMPVRAGSPRSSVLVADGRYQGVQGAIEHWQIGRLLLDLVVPAPGSNDSARLWYRAIAAYLLSRLEFGEAAIHLKRAGELFPTDADLVYDSGRLQENFASPRVQGAVRAAATVQGLRPDVASRDAHLRAAEPLFRRAVELRPGFVEARVRLGRTLELLGKHEAAVDELERALRESEDSTTTYLAHMFVGNAQQALGRRAEAADHFAEAGRLFPTAQSPHLALAQQARRRGDRRGALNAVSLVLTLPDEIDRRDDPWWTYFELPTGDADALVRMLRTHVARLETP